MMQLTITDAFMALNYSGMPEMIIKNMPHGFVMVPFHTILNKFRNTDYESWQYAFVNREQQMYKINFDSLDDLVDTLFKAKEICYGTYPQDAQPNPLYGKSLEQLKIEKDLLDNSKR